MTEKMTSITTDQNEIVSSIQKLSPKAGDVLMFYVKTDDDWDSNDGFRRGAADRRNDWEYFGR